MRISKNDFPLPPGPFVQRLQLRASLMVSTKRLDDLEVLLDYDPSGTLEPCGYVLGNNETSKAIETLDKTALPRGAFLVASESGVEATVDFAGLQTRGYGPGPTTMVGRFACRQLTIRSNIEAPTEPTRTLIFLMTGPRRHWAAGFFRSVSYTGAVSVETYDRAITLDLDLPFTLEVSPHFFYSREETSDQQVTTQVLSVTAETSRSRESFADDDFVHEAIKVIDDCSLLVSFMSGSWVTWYGYLLGTGDRIIEHFRTVRPGQDVDPNDSPVDIWKARDFLRTAVPRLQQLRLKGEEPRLALLHAISASEALSLEEKFIRLFLALESLKDLHARSRKREFIMDEKTFRKVRHALRAVLTDSAQDPSITLSAETLKSLERKLPELNRRAFAELLDELLQDHGLAWRDLYPPHAELTRPPFIHLRDQLIHTGAVDSPQLLWFETVRLQGLVERVLLRMLGWQDISDSPRGYLRMLLLTKLGHEPPPTPDALPPGPESL